MNKMVRAVEEYIDENESVQEMISDGVKVIINNSHLSAEQALDISYGLVFSKLLKKLSKRVYKENVTGNVGRRRVRKGDGLFSCKAKRYWAA